LATTLAVACSGVVWAAPQDQDRDRGQQDQQTQDQNRDRDQNQTRDRDRDHDRDQNRAVSQNGDDSRYSNNKYYEEGWKDGQKHKHKNRKFKNDDDREAYEAGYAHGDRGEQWQKPHRDRDKDNH
jgi:hypothetical protein